MDQVSNEQQQIDNTAVTELRALVEQLKTKQPNFLQDVKRSAKAFDALAERGLTARSQELSDVLVDTEDKSAASLRVNAFEYLLKCELKLATPVCNDAAQEFISLLNDLSEFFTDMGKTQALTVGLGIDSNDEAPLTANEFTDMFTIENAHRCGERLVIEWDVIRANQDLERAVAGSIFYVCWCSWALTRITQTQPKN
ncbi:hypothetical protein [Vibrio barjaei]|uniref:hypothetical protein n=1 Tax=Vibrio barjaei TaxID=1676683 RepID=UPI002283FCC3|nr:hypothetical protein [Vibrio barjaei]MCY9873216.1 hypothetical protein [Vibrio barjaei]